MLFLGEFFFVNIFFLFLFSRRERTRFGWGGLVSDRHADQQKHVARLVRCCMDQLQPGCQSSQRPALVLLRVDHEQRFGNQQHSRGILFCEYFLSISLFSQRENALRLVRIGRRTTCRSAEARGKTCALLSGPVATEILLLQRIGSLLFRLNRERQFRKQQHSGEFFCVSNCFFLVPLSSFFAQREGVSIGADFASSQSR
jgi:hypothetical protein